jgi:hypothetical protein
LIHLPSPSARAWHEIGLGTCHKEGSALMHWVKTVEVQIAPIRDAEGPGFYWQDIAHIDIARLAVADVNEAWNAATQIEQRVELDRRLGGAKRSPIDQPTIQTVSREADIQLIVPRVAPHPPVVNYG